MRNKKTIITFFFIFLIVLYLIASFESLDRDTGAFLTIASGILKGNLPYVDYFDHKPPGIYYLLASLLALKNSIYVAKLGTMLFNVATVITLFFIGKKLWNKEVGILSSMFYLAGLVLYGGYRILTEPFLAFFSALAILCFVEHYYTKKNYYLFLSGILIGISMLFKHSGILTLFGLFFFYLLVVIKSKRIYTPLKNSAMLSIGFLLPIVLTSFYFYSVDALNDLIYCVYSINIHHYGPVGGIAVLKNNLWVLSRFPLFWIFSISGIIIAVVQYIKDKNPNKEIFISILFIFSVIPIIIEQTPRYYVQILPFASLLASYTLFKLKDPIKPLLESDQKIVVILIILFLIAPTLEPIGMVTIGMIPFNLNDNLKIGDYIKSHTKPDEKIFVITAAPEYYFLSNRNPMDKNIYLLSINLNNTYTEESTIQKLRDEKIRYVLLNSIDDELKEIYAYIYENYELEKEFSRKSIRSGISRPMIRVYKKKGAL